MNLYCAWIIPVEQTYSSNSDTDGDVTVFNIDSAKYVVTVMVMYML